MRARLVLVLISSLLFASIARAQVAVPATNVHAHQSPVSHRNPRRGWFFYDNPIRLPKVKPRKFKPKTETTPTNPYKKQTQVGSVKWIATHIKQIRSTAIDDPTRQNLELYAYVQKLMLDKAEVFANKFVRVVANNPALDESHTRPLSTFANASLSASSQGTKNDLLAKLGKTTAIWFFFRSDCVYCEKQTPLLQMLHRQYGFNILPISLNGLPLDSGQYANSWVPDEGQGRILGITATPTLYIVRPESNDIVFLDAGLRALPELETRILTVARGQKWITQDQYQKAMVGDVHHYLTATFDPSKIKNPNDYADILKAFKSAGNKEIEQTELSSLSPHTSLETPWYGKAQQ